MSDLLDPRLPLTAGEVRAAGGQVPEHVPDHATCPRSAMRVVAVKAERKGDPRDREFRVVFQCEFLEPFRW